MFDENKMMHVKKQYISFSESESMKETVKLNANQKICGIHCPIYVDLLKEYDRHRI
jgi:hypothetical protein